MKLASKFCRRFVEKKLLKPKQILTNNLLSKGEKTKLLNPSNFLPTIDFFLKRKKQKLLNPSKLLPTVFFLKGRKKTKAAKPKQIDTNNRLPFKGKKQKLLNPSKFFFLGSVI